MNPIYIVVAAPLLLGGCTATSLMNDAASYDDAANPTLGAGPIRYQTPVAGYTHRAPVDPKPWRNQNDAQAPKGDAS
ncbi:MULTISPECIES: hypothetical protein [Agrobacterium]|jgi:hypothetical protein|uniref:Lipoprotein n=4 Tax=Agrobacterium tumefaciens complex TaxID=1183400 RepID=A0AAP4YUN2_AGRTU|nr:MULTISPECIES: hypothetical protein [Agrobacterium]MCP2136690.1 hypothetical protein [Rhizobium sp. SLBN-94]TGE77051.1 hypothetical protein C9410_21325 [Rhizobium sp. SEMIA 439]AYM83766.1 hypothetical protein At12D1_38830 [Agrobacterium tumefaciens]EHH03898.1 hypothetical protein ATCR1_19511 [Agrobacterium tumefaciens CCNWGS0286]KAB0457343.1 hypothetical protein F7R04_22575 [Agrobacterium tumefaciens]